MTSREKVSILVASYGRHQFLQSLYKCFDAQSYTDIELLVYDSSPQKCPSLERMDRHDARFTYVHSAERLRPGPARNLLLSQVKGGIVAHWDDDDYYSPNYIQEMVAALGKQDFVCLSGWFAFSQPHQQLFYWDTESLGKLHFQVSPVEEYVALDGEELKKSQHRHRFYGFSHVYRKQVAEGYQFAAGWGHDWEFVRFLINNGASVKCFRDQMGLCLHVVHQSNTARLFPQFVLPDFMFESIFGSEALPYKTLAPDFIPPGKSPLHLPAD